LRHKRKSKLFKTFKLFIPVLFILSILWVWKSTAAKGLSQQLTRAEKQKKTLIEDNKRLQAELEQYRSVGWIDSRVRTDYGMTYDIKNRMIFMENQPTAVKPVRPGLYAGILGNLRDIWNFFTGK
jgi:cell division protein FtsB